MTGRCSRAEVGCNVPGRYEMGCMVPGGLFRVKGKKMVALRHEAAAAGRQFVNHGIQCTRMLAIATAVGGGHLPQVLDSSRQYTPSNRVSYTPSSWVYSTHSSNHHQLSPQSSLITHQYLVTILTCTHTRRQRSAFFTFLVTPPLQSAPMPCHAMPPLQPAVQHPCHAMPPTSTAISTHAMPCLTPSTSPPRPHQHQ